MCPNNISFDVSYARFCATGFDEVGVMRVAVTDSSVDGMVQALCYIPIIFLRDAKNAKKFRFRSIIKSSGGLPEPSNGLIIVPCWRYIHKILQLSPEFMEMVDTRLAYYNVAAESTIRI